MPEKYELIICEKPAQAQKIAEALADKKPTKKTSGKIAYYELEHQGKKIVVGCAVGHLYTLGEKNKKAWHYPIFDYEWKPSYEVNKAAKFTKAYLDVLKKLAKGADQFIVGTDVDVEGDVIGWNIISLVCQKKDARRMKFSTLTRDELIESYEHASPHLDFPQIESGVTRHGLDWLFGLNLTRALTLSVKNATGNYTLLSSGRVQGPTLKILYDREREIQQFKPEPYWEIFLTAEIKKQELLFEHAQGRFLKKEDAQTIVKKTQDKEASVATIEKKETKQKPPIPFDLTSLQIEAYGVLGINPQRTLDIAQDLYTNGWISYPRTSSQKLPESINYKKILKGLAPQFAKETTFLLNKTTLVPNNGKKEDPAHPAIYPTGELPKRIEDKTGQLYEPIVRRFFATFGDDAVRESITITLDVNNEHFKTSGTRTTYQGWFDLYRPFVKLAEEELPLVQQGDNVPVREITLEEKETQPPRRYTEASIIKELEKENLGTKCVTADTQIIVKSNIPKSVKISELFEESFKIPASYDNLELSLNYMHECISLERGRMIESHYRLISKRKLEYGEEVYQIIFTDGSIFKATSGHPVLCYKDKQLVYKLISQLTSSDKAVSNHAFIDKIGSFVLNWRDFLFKCDKKTKLYAAFDLTSVRKESQYNLAEKLNVTQSEISIWEKKKIVPLHILKNFDYLPEKIHTLQHLTLKNPFPLQMSSSLTRILANLIGDGSVDREKIKRENCYDFRYHNKNLHLILRFVRDVEAVFGITPPYKLDEKQRYYVKVPAAVGRILFLIAEELLTKDVSKLISLDFYPEFVGAVFDDEGHTTKNEPKLFISNTNFRMLETLKRMLSILDIHSSLSKRQYKLYIRGRKNICFFLQKIPICSFKKKKRLIDHLSRFYAYGGASKLLLQKDILRLLSQGAQTSFSLASQLRIRRATLVYHLNTLIKQGFIRRTTVGISERPRKKISYELILDPSKSFYSLVGEQLITQELVTKSISSVNKIPYQGEVYDITNTPEAPNFMLANGVLVHNSTRASILQNLYDRNYVTEKSITVTDLGMKTIETLEKYCPEILDQELTRKFEEEMEQIIEQKKKGADVIAEAKIFLDKTLKKFKIQEKNIGEALSKAYRETLEKENHIGICPVCKQGNLQMRRGKFGLFAACSRYPDCKTTFSLPKNAKVIGTDKECDQCHYPLILVIRARRKPQQSCINPECPPKKALEEKIQAYALGKKCPKCGKDLVVRKSFYGSFIACPGFPACRYIEKMPEQN